MNFHILNRILGIPQPFDILIAVVIAVAIVFVLAMIVITFGDTFSDWTKKKFQQLQTALKARFYEWNNNGVWGVCAKEAFDANPDAVERQYQQLLISALGRTLMKRPKIANTMTFSDSTDVNPCFLTGNMAQKNELFKNCIVERRVFHVPFTSTGRELLEEVATTNVVTMDQARQIVKNAKPKPIRNFIRRHRHNINVTVAAAMVIVVIVITLGVQRYYSNTGVVQVHGDRVYAVGYHTRFGYVPSEQTFEELKADPAVWGIIWTEKSNEPDTEYWYDYQCGQGFWGNRCEFLSEGRVVHPSQFRK